MLRTAGSHVRPRALLVKVGNGSFRVLHPPPGKDISHFLDMDVSTLLKAIAGDSTFVKSMEGMAQDQCTVSVVISTASVKPTAEELARSTVLEGALTVGHLVLSDTGNIWVYIEASTEANPTGKSQRVVSHATLYT